MLVEVEVRVHLAQIKHVLGSYIRYFAGRPHGACDQLHLRELIQRLGHHQERAKTDALGQRHALLSRLLHEIESHTPSSPADRANNLALLANQQFLLFERHFAGQPRVSRRPALLQRILSNLRSIASELRSVELSKSSAKHKANLALIEKQLLRFEAEATESAREREKTSSSQLLRMLAAAADLDVAAYRRDFESRDRNIVDIDQLAGICDRMGEIVYQTVEIIPALTDEQDRALATDHLQIASANLDRFEVEHNVIGEQRKQFISLVHVVESATALRDQLMTADASEAVRRQAVTLLDALVSDPVVREIVDRAKGR